MPGKRKIELTLDADLVAEAEASGIDLPVLLEKAMMEVRSEQRAARWREENDDAIAISNAELAANGMWHCPAWLDQ